MRIANREVAILWNFPSIFGIGIYKHPTTQSVFKSFNERILVYDIITSCSENHRVWKIWKCQAANSLNFYHIFCFRVKSCEKIWWGSCIKNGGFCLVGGSAMNNIAVSCSCPENLCGSSCLEWHFHRRRNRTWLYVYDDIINCCGDCCLAVWGIAPRKED